MWPLASWGAAFKDVRSSSSRLMCSAFLELLTLLSATLNLSSSSSSTVRQTAGDRRSDIHGRKDMKLDCFLREIYSVLKRQRITQASGACSHPWDRLLKGLKFIKRSKTDFFVVLSAWIWIKFHAHALFLGGRQEFFLNWTNKTKRRRCVACSSHEAPEAWVMTMHVLRKGEEVFSGWWNISDFIRL